MSQSDFATLAKLAEASSPPFNIAVIGATGVGKSRLINAFFGVDVAAVGVGRPITMEITAYSVPNSKAQIFDTRGLEVERSRETVAAVENLVVSARNKADIDAHIHIAWLCVSAASKRFEPVYETMAQMLTTINVPFIIAITKSFGPEADELERHIRSLHWINAPTVTVVSAPKTAGGEVVVEARGLDRLAAETANLLGTARAAAADYHRYDASRREKTWAALNQIIENKTVLQQVGTLYARGYSIPLMLVAKTMIADKICEDLFGAAAKMEISLSLGVKSYMRTAIANTIYEAAMRKVKSNIDEVKTGFDDVVGGDLTPLKNMFGTAFQRAKRGFNLVESAKDVVKLAKGEHIEVYGHQAWEYIREISLVMLSPIAEAYLVGQGGINHEDVYYRSLNSLLKWSGLASVISSDLASVLTDTIQKP